MRCGQSPKFSAALTPSHSGLGPTIAEEGHPFSSIVHAAGRLPPRKPAFENVFTALGNWLFLHRRRTYPQRIFISLNQPMFIHNRFLRSRVSSTTEPIITRHPLDTPYPPRLSRQYSIASKNKFRLKKLLYR